MPSTKRENATDVAAREYSPMVQVMVPLLTVIDGAKLGSIGGTNTGVGAKVVMELEVLDATELPMALVAMTVNV